MTYWPSIGVSLQQRILFTISMSMLNVGQMEMLGKLETDTTNVITEIGRLSHLKNQWSTTSQIRFITFSFTIGSINLGLSSIGQLSKGVFTCHVSCFYILQRATNFGPSHYTRRHSNRIWEMSAWSWANQSLLQEPWVDLWKPSPCICEAGWECGSTSIPLVSLHFD